MKTSTATDKVRFLMEQDRQLVKQILYRGEKEKFGVLVERYQRPLYRFLRRMGLDHDEAGDTMQNAFIKAYNKLHSLREDGSFRSWIYRIAANEARNYFRRSARLVPFSPESLDENSLVDEKEDPAGQVERRSLRDRIEKAMSRLPETQRRVVVLRAFEDLPFKEIAYICRMSLSGVKVSYHRALKKMSEWLKMEGCREINAKKVKVK